MSIRDDGNDNVFMRFPDVIYQSIANAPWTKQDGN